jgi:single-strand DNA-binding protein
MKQVKGTVNRVELIGWLGAAPEQRTLPSGVAVCNLTVATKRWAGRSEDGNRAVETDWTPIEAWDRLAERCTSSLHKGSRVRVSGSLITRSWEDRESGQRRTKTFVRAEEVLFLDTRQGPQDEAEEDVEVVGADEPPF